MKEKFRNRMGESEGDRERDRERNFGLPAYSKFVRHNRFLPTEKFYPHVRTREAAAAVAAGGVHMCISQLLSVDFFRVFKCPLQPKPGPARPGPDRLPRPPRASAAVPP